MSAKYFINNQTGEVIIAYSKIHAYAYFKADGKKYNYKVSLKDVRLLSEYATQK